ncbi:SDR family NAD(P)-dependent oxidoreductase [Hoeflea prorocentri]|uniref:SDR family NAD(P)-dependent oxidoreductase n=1 Tax=Hoeflea prorocentri TaxID=1922333 RepID=A0A9X3UIK3_9HYPH|nr:SDR family NAD(P)-dependent oxidoreductase [Hoeflea prorocentri]MCY6381324.1 SDR family NAD(P)-dependent oxidoreductase [Hoeflea prorocentri]MDA5399124.1 SDR family NAD(P)-dependent oxidoreductase [Hoeflea prorocentri]
MAKLSGKHAVVTGGGSGVGAAIALALAEKGATVTVSGRRREALDAVAGSADRISARTCDVTDPDSVASLFSALREEHGGVNIVIANAGAAEASPFAKLEVEEWRRTIDVNLTGAFLTLHGGLAAMEGKDWGRMISIASVAGLRGYPYVAHYCAAKHGVIGLTRSLAMEIATSGITVNAICPGYTETPMLTRALENVMDKTGMERADAEKALLRTNPMGRFIQPEEVARTVLWLCGPDSGAITGQAISVSGGEV